MEGAMSEVPVRVSAGEVELDGDLTIPRGAGGVVVFAHGSGSSRKSPRNRQVAAVLRDAGMATLLFDLLTREEEAAERDTGELRFDIPLLADRLLGVTRWLQQQEDTKTLRIGYFGASTGAAAAIVAASRLPDSVGPIVSRGGRPDLAGEALRAILSPVLLIVGGEDRQVLELNEEAARQIRSTVDLEVIPGASHLFIEPGTLSEVARLASEFFALHLPRLDGAALYE
jgi:putative phosphoribosyl transferase